MNKFGFIVFIFSVIIIKGQVPVVININGDTLNCPFAGGLNAPQFSNIDIDGDGKQDLFVFDRTDNSVSIFVNKGNYDFIYSEDYSNRFPRMRSWALLRDYDCDGLPDIYTAVSSYIRVYKNLGNLNFTIVYDTIVSEYFSGVSTYLYSSYIDIPAIVDVDFDGDLDIIVWDLLSGVKLEYHKNLSMEQTGQCGNIIMKKASACFGHFHEYYDYVKNSYTAVLNDPPCGPGQRLGDPDEKIHMHSGGTVTDINFNGDTLMDFIISDNGPWDLIGLINGGSRAIAHFTYADTAFPRSSVEAKMYFFPAAYYVDVDGDNVKELLISPNDPTAANYNNVWLYENNGATISPLFVFQQKDFLINQMIDVGKNAAPAIFDYEGDGDYDLVIASGRKLLDDSTETAFIMLLENIGSNSNPIFKVINEDLLQFNNYAHTQYLREVVPFFGDVDGDGDKDLIFGEANGTVWYYKNVAQPGTPAIFAYQKSPNPFDVVNVVANSAPTLYDLDNDGDLDLFVGNKTGEIYAYINTGTPNNPVFTLLDNNWGGIKVTNPSYIGYTQPLFYDIDNDSFPEVLVGNINGNIIVYDSVELAAKKTFPILDTINIGMLSNSKIALFKVANDSIHLYSGTERGGIIFKLLTNNLTTSINKDKENFVILSPNPADDIVNINFIVPGDYIISVYDIKGRELYSKNIIGSKYKLDVSMLPFGIYFVKIIDIKTGFFTYSKLIIN